MKWVMASVAGLVVVGVLALLGLGARDGRGLATAAVEIGRPPAQVFPLLVEPALRKQWLLAVEEISPSGDPTPREGARSRVVLDVPQRMEVEEEMRVVETDRRLLLQRVCSHPPFNQRLEYVLRDLGGRTLVTAAVHTTYQGFFFNLGEPLLTRAAGSQLHQELAQLRTAVESPAAPAASPATSAAPPADSPPQAPDAPAEAAPPPDATQAAAAPPVPEAAGEAQGSSGAPAGDSPEVTSAPAAPPPETLPASDPTATP